MRHQPHISRMLWLESIGFATIIFLSWGHEIFGPRLWSEAAFETLLALAVAAPIMSISYRIVSRLYALEQFLRVCAWCRKIHCDGRWYSMEEYFQKGFAMETSHGICPGCAAEEERKMDERTSTSLDRAGGQFQGIETIQSAD